MIHTEAQPQKPQNQAAPKIFSKELCQTLWKKAPEYRCQLLIKELNEQLDFYQLNSQAQRYHFITQILIDAQSSLNGIEQLTYTPKELKHYFFVFAQNPQLAEQLGYSNQPKDGQYLNSQGECIDSKKQQQIANQIYANRFGNGSIQSNEGWFYRGRGYLRIRGKSQYQAFNDWYQENKPRFNLEPDALKLRFAAQQLNQDSDFVNAPSALAQPPYAARAAAYRWLTSGAYKKATDLEDQTLIKVTRALRGYNTIKIPFARKVLQQLKFQQRLGPINP